MIFSIKEGFINTEGFEEVRYKEYTFYYSGVLYLRGKKAGRESVLAVAEEYEATGVIPFIKIYGAFYLIISKPDGETIFFTDNSNLHCFFMGESYIGDNFLELIKYEKSNEFNMEALCEFFVLGGVYFGKTLIDGIRLSSNDSYYIYTNNTIKEVTKDIGDIDAPSSISDVSEFFQDMAYALSDQKVTLSLTGGYDSRMVFACIKKHLPINVFISGNKEYNSDIIQAQKTAYAGGQTLEIINVEKPEVSEDYLTELFHYAQAIVPFVNDGYIRISSFIKNRKEQGYNCYLSGDGGAVHKDRLWTQDFPFYNKRKVDLKRYYNMRVHFTKQTIPIDKDILALSNELENRFINKISQFRKPSNSQSYDSFYYNINADKFAVQYSTHSKSVYSYAPLWELELVRYSYHLTRWERYFYKSVRKITTKNSRSIARVPTVYGTTASSEPLYLLRDIYFQLIDYFVRAIRMLGRKFLNKNLLVGNPSTWSVEDDIRNMDIANRALSYCIDKGFLKLDTRIESISYSTLGRAIQIYMLAEFMKHNNENS